ncbi:hypothetical protein QQS21_000941 [Conoideocrella luteorostrata]|uniref:Uncharacterized protein n=1 Tax=Conoideocrella luteorostrata TaxID=1105319 RepID=A0AAJ0D173_9HYPO|nr:hypothetical protein QQS21_000941 [Conoideocrella luteorostrata]
MHFRVSALLHLIFFALLGFSLDLDSIFNEVNSIDYDFGNILRIVSQQVFRKGDSRPIDVSGMPSKFVNSRLISVKEVRKSVESATRGLDAASDKIRYDSTIEDDSDVVAAFCDDMEVFTHTQLKAADILVFKANNMRDAVKNPSLPNAIVKLSSAYDRYAGQMSPLVRHCDTRQAEDIYMVRSTLHRALVDLKPPGRRSA